MKLSMAAAMTIMAVAINLSGIAHAQSVTVENSDFETPQLNSGIGASEEFDSTGGATVYLNGGSSGWYVTPDVQGTSSSVTLINQGLLGSLLSPISGDGSQYIALNGAILGVGTLTPGTLGGVSQVIDTQAGAMYQVNYEAGALAVSVLGSSNKGQLFAGVGTVSSPTGGAVVSLDVGTFTDESFTFTATGAQSTLNFYEPTAVLNVGGVAIDNVSVTMVPEPRDYTVMFLGFVLVIGLVRKLKLYQRIPREVAIYNAIEE
jgi:hypothetical protein